MMPRPLILPLLLLLLVVVVVVVVVTRWTSELDLPQQHAFGRRALQCVARYRAHRAGRDPMTPITHAVRRGWSNWHAPSVAGLRRRVRPTHLTAPHRAKATCWLLVWPSLQRGVVRPTSFSRWLKQRQREGRGHVSSNLFHCSMFRLQPIFPRYAACVCTRDGFHRRHLVRAWTVMRLDSSGISKQLRYLFIS